MTVLDASAVLAFLGDEPGRAVVGRELATGGCVISAVNWSEVYQKGIQHELPLVALEALSELVHIEPVTRVHGQGAARLWSRAPHLSIADRMCMALALDRGDIALTCDHAWQEVTIPKLRVTLAR